ncbi:WD40 repeat domain-containing protein [Alicyclobacillus sacchari]|uniref:WD40 repeat domain-containing protein n=1 Tax=Alicyclobacillus sacchari TaxID=392010 RepID=UPI0024E0A9A3|nr:WD40 repeat domain-containing protein [Alicyclobacillus sacchari]
MRGNKQAMRLIAAVCATVMVVTGCDSVNKPQQPETENAPPARVQPGALVAGGSTVVAEFVNGKWIYLLAASVVNAPSSAFQTVDVSATGEVAATTPGNSDTLTDGSSGSALWTYHRGWQPVQIQGDTNVQVHAFAPDGTLYAAPDDGQLAGLWKRTSKGWTQVSGTAQLGYITAIVWSPKGVLTVVSIPDNGATTIWQQNGPTWTALGGENTPFAGDTLTVQWSPSGQLTVGSSGHGLFAYDHGKWVPAGGVPSPLPMCNSSPGRRKAICTLPIRPDRPDSGN